ncbi:bifunctional helix-turn-helix transcriptional regulator/GNAT family N-acetyltransferase [Aliiglaciecola sp. LCG003]|uniref:bifunctional helix-turn-helix transcriptional regulator/GNAT family N-acetyltransferase n=1 Tax=Aliiglaciecola sp. LCG003 TaxID=3053655 RepID=UPI0025734B5D|nr:bifunctional helix-turn-helix transcriptional regulator/GNAT family N-acetyltransferase [Aliiglaciecola sp. LCG003]WJG09232.1 bifunctional helix-turn-helix transcriptional regulator/GNAT family N-acetyltransferase [Aliiglaciecola sp. LCG003]
MDELGELALGSRLKRISERMLAEAGLVYQHYAMDVQPKWFTLLALLDNKQQVSVVEASEYLGLSQPALSQFCRQLENKKLISLTTSSVDSRKKVIALSDLGKEQVARMKPIWKAVDSAAKQLCEAYDNQFYQSLLQFEKALDEQSLLARTHHFYNAEQDTTMQPNRISIVDYTPQRAAFFESINTQWIEAMFVLEEVDKQVLRDPQKFIIDPGGKIWFAQHPEFGIVGACALLSKGEGAYELTKMGVLENARGLKVGEILLQYVIQQANNLPLDCLFLLTNKKCEAAIHLYEKNGFVHDADIMAKYGASYQRCNVAMRWVG